LPTSGRKLAIIIILMVVFASLSYSIASYSMLRDWIIAGPLLGGLPGMFNSPAGINGSIAMDRGASVCSLPFPDPPGNVLVQSSHGNIIQAPVDWTFTHCDYKIGFFQILVPPGKYQVSFTGFALTSAPIAQVNLSNLPLTVVVEPDRLAQVHIGINFGI
jgi:hypothetical protein